MLLKVILAKQSDPSFSQSIDFDKFPIFIGREEKNDIILPDPFKVVSRKHAKIINTEGILQLVDLESQNFTYLNENRIEPNDENSLNSGDKIKIGEYELEVQLIKFEETFSGDDQKTMVFTSPFGDEIALLAENFKSLSQKYSDDPSSMKAEMLRFSIFQNLNTLPKNDLTKIFAEYFSENFLPKEINQKKTGMDWDSSSPVKESEIKISAKRKTEKIIGNDSFPQISPEFSFSSHFSNTTDILLDAFSKLISGFLQFRQEFFGVTIYHLIPAGSLNELKEYLFSPGISSEEEKKRLSMLKEEIQKLLTHQVGLLEGYRNSISEGSKLLLQSLDPEIVEKEFLERNQKSSGLDIGKILPFMQKQKILKIIKDDYQKYMSDPYHIEKKYFRPSFLKGYQKRMVSRIEV